MSKFDTFLIENQLSDEELLIQKTAKDYAEQSLMPRILEANRNENFDREIYNELGSLGLLGPTINGYGCAGVNYVSYGLIAKELEKVATPTTKKNTAGEEGEGEEETDNHWNRALARNEQS